MIEYIEIQDDILVISGNDRFFISDIRTVKKNYNGNLVINREFNMSTETEEQRNKFYVYFDLFYKNKAVNYFNKLKEDEAKITLKSSEQFNK